MRELEFAKRVALRAGDFLRKHQKGPLDIRYKDGPANLVTKMDHASEEMIVRAIRREFPDHAILAEERGASGDSPYRWYIDPVDGTTNYAHGFAIWGVTLALEAHGEIVVGVTYAPAFGDLYWARRGGGSFRNGKRLKISKTDNLPGALLCTGFPYKLKYRRQNLKYFGRFLEQVHAIRRVGAASLDLAWTAAGVFDGFWEFRLGPWDMAAGTLLLSEAGGTISAFAGGPVDLHRGELVAGNAVLHRKMLRVIRKVGLPKA